MTHVWEAGLPSRPGIYWFDPGFRGFSGETPMVIRVLRGGGSTYGYGDYGSGPIDQYYSPKVCPKACHLAIAFPGESWQGPDCIKRNARAWVKSPEGYLGFGLLRPGYNGTAGGSVLWIDHPTTGETHGGWMGDSYSFCPVPVPDLIR